jgi:hypothetical protein
MFLAELRDIAIPDPQSGIPDPQNGIPDPRSGIPTREALSLTREALAQPFENFRKRFIKELHIRFLARTDANATVERWHARHPDKHTFLHQAIND